MSDPRVPRTDVHKRYREVFSGAAGKDVLQDLRYQFYDVELTGKNAHHTALAVGGHRVLRYILDMLEDAGE